MLVDLLPLVGYAKHKDNMAKTATKKRATKKPVAKRNALLPKQVRFNIPTFVALTLTLVVIGYFVIKSFAAGGFYRAKGKCGNVNTFAGYSCFFDSADGLAARMYITLLNRTPNAASIDAWANKIVSTGKPAQVAQQIVSTSEGQANFLHLAQGSRVNAMFLRLLNRGPVASDGPGNWSGSFKENANVGTAWYYFVTNYRTESVSSNWLATKMVQSAPVVTPPPAPQPQPQPQPQPEPEPQPQPQPEPEPEPVTPPTDDTYNPYDGYAVSQDNGDAQALESLGEVSLDDLSGASDEKIQQIIEENTTKQKGTSGSNSNTVDRVYSGKLKLLPPSQAISDGPDQVYYYINGKLKAKVKKAPFSYVLDTTRLPNKACALTIVSYQKGEKLGEYTYALRIKNNLNLWQKIYNLVTAPFAG